MSENEISLDEEGPEAEITYTEAYVEHKMTPMTEDVESVSINLGTGDRSWNPEGGWFRGPDIIHYIHEIPTGIVVGRSLDMMITG